MTFFHSFAGVLGAPSFAGIQREKTPFYESQQTPKVGLAIPTVVWLCQVKLSISGVFARNPKQNDGDTFFLHTCVSFGKARSP
jgi:hypothetical protein